MPQVFDHQSDYATIKAALEVDFTLPVAGWVKLRIRPLHEKFAVACTCIWDPFVRMIEWLEQIAQGCDAATWYVDEEGSASRLQFYGGAGKVDDRSDYLLHIRSDNEGIDRVRGVKVDRYQLVESFYRGFRKMADDPAYEPHECDAHPHFYRMDDMDWEEYDRAYQANPFDGYWLRDLTSRTIEDYLNASDARQLDLFRTGDRCAGTGKMA